MTDTKLFPLGDVLSVTTGRMVSEDGMDGLYRILGWMRGADLHVFQLAPTAEAARPVLREMYPLLSKEALSADISRLGKRLSVEESPPVRADIARRWVALIAARVGVNEVYVPKLVAAPVGSPEQDTYEARRRGHKAKSDGLLSWRDCPYEDAPLRDAWLEGYDCGRRSLI